nr:hypothetical protein [Streptomyces sp. IMTB 2501]
MFFEPGGEGLGGVVGQDVDDAAGLDVDEDRAVDVTALECEVVDAQYPRALLRRLGRQPPHTVKQGVRADRAVQQSGEPDTGPTGQAACDRYQHRLLQLAAAAVAAVAEGEPVDPLDEGSARARRLLAPEPANRQTYRRRLSTDRDVSEPPTISVVDSL